MIETARQREKREKAESAERQARQERYLAKQGAKKPAVKEGPITEAEARLLTKRIVDASEGLAQLLLEAHRREAWKALGYESWRAYAMAEFKFSRGRIYQLLNHAEVVEEISSDAKIPPLVEIPSERVTRKLAPLTKSVRREVIKKAVKISRNGRPTAREVESVIERKLNRRPTTQETTGSGFGSLYRETIKSVRSAWKRFNLDEQTGFREFVENLV